MKKLITLVLVIVLTVSLCGNLSGCLLIHAINTTLERAATKQWEEELSGKTAFFGLENGNYFLGVHIADVSYYVKENSEIDKEGV